MSEPAALRAGLTGGIGSGKSTVARRFAERGAVVVDLDRVSHAVTAPGGPAHRAVVDAFGPEICDDEGAIDRRRLGEIVFADPSLRARLEGIVHPIVREEGERLAREGLAESSVPIAVVDAALLVESGGWQTMDRLVVTSCQVETQVRRVMARDGLDEAEVRRRIAAQAPLERKLAVADYVIDTEHDLTRTLAECDRVFAALVEDQRDGRGTLR